MIRKVKNELPRPWDVVPALSGRIDWAIRRAMSAAPQQQPASCQEFVEDLLGQSDRMPRASESVSLWYLTYTDTGGREQTIKGSIEAMRHSLQQGRLGNPTLARASRTAAGPVEPLAKYGEFRDLLVEPAPGPPLSVDSGARLALGTGGVAHGLSGSEAEPKPAEQRVAPAKGQAPASRWPERLKMLTLIGVTVAVTVIAAKYVLPGGK
jgi:hypothetical protein